MHIKDSEIDNTSINTIIIKTKNDLREKLQEGEDDIKNGNVITLDEAFDEIDNMLN